MATTAAASLLASLRAVTGQIQTGRGAQLNQVFAPPPGFTWIGPPGGGPTSGLYMPLVPGNTPTPGPAYSPIAFNGLGMKIGPFVFPWTKETMPGVADPGAPGQTLCVGDHQEFNNTDGKVCPIWSTVVRDWKHLPIGLQNHVRSIFLSDIEGGGHGFGNYWYNENWVGQGEWSQPATVASYRDWMTAFGLNANQDYYLPFLPTQGNGLGRPEDWFLGAPVAQFDHPVPEVAKAQGRFGIWMALEHEAGTNSYGKMDEPYVLRIVVASLNDAKSRIPPASTWSQILFAINPLHWPGMLVRALEEIGGDIISLLGDLVDAAGNLICDLASNPALVTATITGIAASQGVPPQAALGTASQVSSMAAQKCAPKPPNCADPANAKLVQCLPPITPINQTSWWMRWYIVLPAVLVAGYLLTKKPEAATEPCRTSPTFVTPACSSSSGPCPDAAPATTTCRSSPSASKPRARSAPRSTSGTPARGSTPARIVVLLYDASSEDTQLQDFADKLKVKATPTTCILTRWGTRTHEGSMPAAKVDELIAEAMRSNG